MPTTSPPWNGRGGTRRGSSAGQTCVTSFKSAMRSDCRAWGTAGKPMALRRRWSRSSPTRSHHLAQSRPAVTPIHVSWGRSAKPVHAWGYPYEEKRDELDDRPRPRGTRPDRTCLTRYMGARWDDGDPPRNGGLL